MNARRLAAAILPCVAVSAAVAAASPLREIDHTSLTDIVCANVVIHANSAIAASLHDDDALARALAKLRSASFDDDSPGKRAALGELRRLDAEIADDARHGSSETQRLLAIANTATNEHAPEIRTFARALGSALERQNKLGDELEAFVSALDAREMRGQAIADPGDTPSGSPGMAIAKTPTRPSFGASVLSPTGMARNVARDIVGHLDEIAHEESQAAEYAESAVTGC